MFACPTCKGTGLRPGCIEAWKIWNDATPDADFYEERQFWCYRCTGTGGVANDEQVQARLV